MDNNWDKLNTRERKSYLVSPTRLFERAPPAAPMDQPFKERSVGGANTSTAPMSKPVEIWEPSSHPQPQWSIGNANSGSWTMYKVPYRLREVNEKAYEPNAISIGPYHYGKDHLRAMEVIKRSCFINIIEKTKRQPNEFLEPVKILEQIVRDCYEEPCSLESQDYVQMLVFDGCFIVQLIRKIYPEEDLYKLGRRIQTDIWYDLLLLENQLPFFVLLMLDHIIMGNGDQGDADQFARLALSLFKAGVQGPEVWSGSENCPSPKKDINHLLDLVHNSYRPSPRGIGQHNDFKAKAEAQAQAKAKKPKSQRSWKFIRCATELEEAGINFFGQKVQDLDQDQGLASLFDVVFTEDTKVLKIPTLLVDDNTERFLRNLMAYEQLIPSGEPTYVSDYVVLMINLINTGKDVQLLCNSGIIDKLLGNDEAVAQMFNKLGDFIYSSEDFYYAEIFGKVNEHCQIKWNKWKAILKRDYFNSPWSLISFLAAVVLLLLTLIQTIFSVLSYFQ